MQRYTEFQLGAGKATEIKQAYDSAGDTFRVLDLGCGSAGYHESMEEFFSGMSREDKDVKIVGADYSMENLLNGDTESKVRLDAGQESDGFYLPFQDDCFDLVYSRHLFCQLEKEENSAELIENVRDSVERIIKDSGVQYHEC